MTIANLNIGGQKFVVVPRKEFDRLKRQNEEYQALVREDAELGKLAEKELKAFRKQRLKVVVARRD